MRRSRTSIAQTAGRTQILSNVRELFAEIGRVELLKWVTVVENQGSSERVAANHKPSWVWPNFVTVVEKQGESCLGVKLSSKIKVDVAKVGIARVCK